MTLDTLILDTRITFGVMNAELTPASIKTTPETSIVQRYTYSLNRQLLTVTACRLTTRCVEPMLAHLVTLGTAEKATINSNQMRTKDHSH